MEGPSSPKTPARPKHDIEEQNEQLRAELEEVRKHWMPPSAKRKITDPIVDPVAEELFARQAVNASPKPYRIYTEPRRRGDSQPKARASKSEIHTIALQIPEWCCVMQKKQSDLCKVHRLQIRPRRNANIKLLNSGATKNRYGTV